MHPWPSHPSSIPGAPWPPPYPAYGAVPSPYAAQVHPPYPPYSAPYPVVPSYPTNYYQQPQAQVPQPQPQLQPSDLSVHTKAPSNPNTATAPSHNDAPLYPPGGLAADAPLYPPQPDAPLYPPDAPLYHANEPLYPPGVLNDLASTTPASYAGPMEPVSTESVSAGKDVPVSQHGAPPTSAEEEEEGPLRERVGKIPTIGQAETMNLSKDLHMAIMNCEYFKEL